MPCTTPLLQPEKSIELTRTNSNHQFDYLGFDFVYVNGVKVPIIDQIWLGGCNYRRGIIVDGQPIDKCFMFSGTEKQTTCLEVVGNTIDEMHKCYYPEDAGGQEMWEYIRTRIENAVTSGDITKKTRHWIQPRTIYQASKMLRNPADCLFESHADNTERCVEQPEQSNDDRAPEPSVVVESPTTCLKCERRI